MIPVTNSGRRVGLCCLQLTEQNIPFLWAEQPWPNRLHYCLGRQDLDGQPDLS